MEEGTLIYRYFFPSKKWFCRLNIDSNHNSCDVPEKEEDVNNEDDDLGT